MSPSVFKMYTLLFLALCFGCNDSSVTNGYVAFGDSHIAKYDVGTFFPNSNVRNLGVSGLLISEIETELRAQSFTEERLILHAGTNDYIRAFNQGIPEDEFIDQVELDLMNLLSATNDLKEVILIGSLPVTAEFFDNASFFTLDSVDKILAQQCQATPGCKYISSNILWDEEGFLDRNYSSDLIHLNVEGYQQLSAAIYHEMD